MRFKSCIKIMYIAANIRSYLRRKTGYTRTRAFLITYANIHKHSHIVYTRIEGSKGCVHARAKS